MTTFVSNIIFGAKLSMKYLCILSVIGPKMAHFQFHNFIKIFVNLSCNWLKIHFWWSVPFWIYQFRLSDEIFIRLDFLKDAFLCLFFAFCSRYGRSISTRRRRLSYPTKWRIVNELSQSGASLSKNSIFYLNHQNFHISWILGFFLKKWYNIKRKKMKKSFHHILNNSEWSSSQSCLKEEVLIWKTY